MMPLLRNVPMQHGAGANNFMDQHMIMRKPRLMCFLHQDVPKLCPTDLSNTLDVLGQFLADLAMEARHSLSV